MTATSARRGPAVPGMRWVILGLLVLSICINYIHRVALPVAAAMPAFRQEMRLSDAELGLAFSAFFWTYATMQVVAGWLIDRRGVVVVYTVGFLVWSAATVATGLAGGFASVLAARLLLGAGEAVAYPAYAKIIAAGFPEQRRGTANAFIDAGSRTGPALCVLLGGAIGLRYGWRAIFFVLGGAGLLWLLPWLRLSAHVPAARPEPAGGGPGLSAILRQRQAWGTFLGLFCLNYTWYFILNWLPIYLTRERHYTPRMMALYGALPFWGIAATCALFGVLSDRLIARGTGPTRVRIGLVAGGLFLSTLMLPACLVANQAASMVLLMVACLSLGITSSNIGAITQTLAGPAAAGQWMGLQNGMGNLAGIVGPYVTGLIVAQSGGFFAAFLVACVSSAAGACAYLFIVRRVAGIDWSAAPAR